MPPLSAKKYIIVDNMSKSIIPIKLNDKTLTEHLTQSLRDAIIAGSLAPGSKLSEPKLAEQYQTSRGPIREAIRRLEMMQLVQHIPYEGVRVIALSQEHMIQLYHLREALEGKAAALAAEHITNEGLENLKALLTVHQNHQQRTGEYMQANGDYDFHYQVIIASGNALLIQQLTEKIYHLVRMYRRQFSLMSSRSEVALREHEHIYYAIENRDAELAEILMRRHVTRARQEIEQALEAITCE